MIFTIKSLGQITPATYKALNDFKIDTTWLTGKNTTTNKVYHAAEDLTLKSLNDNILNNHKYDSINLSRGTDTIRTVLVDSIYVIAAPALPDVVDIGHFLTCGPNQIIRCIAGSSYVITLPTAPPDKTIDIVKITTLVATNFIVVKCGPNSTFNNYAGSVTTDTLKVLGEAITCRYRAADSTWTITENDLPRKQADARYVARVGHTSGSIFYCTATDVVELPAGLAGQVLVMNGGLPKWVAPSGGATIDSTGNVTVARFGRFTINAQTGTTYTYVISDTGTMVTAANASAQTYTVPPNASVAFPIGAQIMMINTGAGTVTFAPGAAVTLKTANADINLNLLTGQSCYLIKIATNTWYVSGGNSP